VVDSVGVFAECAQSYIRVQVLCGGDNAVENVGQSRRVKVSPISSADAVLSLDRRVRARCTEDRPSDLFAIDILVGC
jgi:hypothetical protein